MFRREQKLRRAHGEAVIPGLPLQAVHATVIFISVLRYPARMPSIKMDTAPSIMKKRRRRIRPRSRQKARAVPVPVKHQVARVQVAANQQVLRKTPVPINPQAIRSQHPQATSQQVAAKARTQAARTQAARNLPAARRKHIRIVTMKDMMISTWMKTTTKKDIEKTMTMRVA